MKGPAPDHVAAASMGPAYLTPRLAEILEQYLADLELGKAPSAQQLAAQHPDLAEPLLEFVASIDYLHGAATGSSGAPRGGFSIQSLGQLGEYRIIRELGRGGMGIVYEAEQMSLGRRVAIKVLPFAAVLDSRQLSRFKNEAQAAAQLQHPHIVPVYSVGCERGVHYYAMQFIDGQPLDRLINELRHAWGYSSLRSVATATTMPYEAADASSAGATPKRHVAPGATTHCELSNTIKQFTGATLPHGKSKQAYFEFVARMIAQVADALEFAHSLGVVHRDVKPSNLLVDQAGNAWITDFGLAQFQAKSNLTISGELIGTLRYMSPEQTHGKPGLVDQRTDIYSLGVTLYELLTLEPVFAGEEKQQILRQVERDEPLAPSRLNPAIPRDLETIVLKAIAKSRDERYSSAQELADDLRRFLSGEPTLARRPTPVERASKWLVRHSRWVAAGMSAALLAIAVLTATTILVSKQKDQTQVALDQAKRNFDRAEANFKRTREVVDRFCTRLAGQLAAVPGAEPIRRELLQDSLGYYRDFIEQAKGDRSLQAELAKAHFRVGEIDEQIGADRDAQVAYRDARQIWSAIATQDNPEAQADMALCDNNLGLIESRLGNVQQAEQHFVAATSRQQQLATRHAKVLRYRQDLALSYNNLGLLLSQSNRLSEALEFYRHAIGLQQQLASTPPITAESRSNLAASYNNLATLLGQSDLAAADDAYRTAVTLQQELVKEYPDVLRLQSDLALTYNNLGAIQGREEQIDPAEASYRQAIDLREQLVRKAPLVVVFRRDLAVTCNNLGFLLSAHQQPAAAIDAFDQARTIFADLVEQFPQSPQHRSSLGGVHNNLGMAYEQLPDLGKATAAYRQAAEEQRAAVAAAPQAEQFRDFLSKHYFNLGRVLRGSGHYAEAAQTAMQRKEICEKDAERLAHVAGELAQAASGLTGEDQAHCRQQAVETLAEAVDNGFTDGQQLASAEFDALRQDSRFLELESRLKSSTSAAPESAERVDSAHPDPQQDSSS